MLGKNKLTSPACTFSFSHFRPSDVTLENSFFQGSSYPRAYLRITYEKTKEVFSQEHHVVCNGKTWKLKRSIRVRFLS